MKVARYNYAHQLGTDIEPLIADLRAMLVGGRYELTAEVKQFEAELGQFLGARFVRGVNTGTDALVVALRALGIGPGDEVITQANTFNATVGAITLVGAEPVLVDVDPETFLIDKKQLSDAIGPRTRVLMPVHLYGKPTPMAEIVALAEAHGLFVIEDAAQAIGARIEGQSVATFGHFGCFSFHPSKNLSAAGDGGAVVARNAELDEALRRQRELGQVGQNNHVVVGFNTKLDALQARILSWKLPRLEQWNDHRRMAAGWYRERLAGLPLSFQARAEEETHVYHLFQVRTRERDALHRLKAGNPHAGGLGVLLGLRSFVAAELPLFALGPRAVAVVRLVVQDHHVSLRTEGPAHPPHHLPHRDLHVSRLALGPAVGLVE